MEFNFYIYKLYCINSMENISDRVVWWLDIQVVQLKINPYNHGKDIY